MLSRVACNLYWIGRYLERAESTARLVNVHSHLLFDLPRRVAAGWGPMVEIVGADREFAQLYEEASETNIVRFLLIDDRYSGSVLSSLRAARENLRTTRDAMPREIWERVNDLYHWVRDNGERCLQRRWRRDFLDRVIDTNLLVLGTLYSSMSHDVGFQFLRIGSRLEQADMTTRILDVRSVSLISTTAGEDLRPFQSIQWMSVLKSLTAYQMYRQHAKRRVSGAEVLRFLLQDPQFPRSVWFCLTRIGQILSMLPRREPVEKAMHQLATQVHDADVDALVGEGLSLFLDEIQIGIAGFGTALDQAYFRA